MNYGQSYVGGRPLELLFHVVRVCFGNLFLFNTLNTAWWHFGKMFHFNPSPGGTFIQLSSGGVFIPLKECEKWTR